MKSTSETGHVTNVANFAEILSRISTMGTAYAPSNPSYALPTLQAQHMAAKNALQNLIDRNTAFNNAVNERMDHFSDLKFLATRVVSAIKACNPGHEIIKDAVAINRKFTGRRAKALPAVSPETPAPKTISVSQLSYDSLIQHFKTMISLAMSVPNYAPNETVLSIAGLNAKLADMETSNDGVSTAYTHLCDARNVRLTILYSHQTGLVDTGLGVKNYIHAAFGNSSGQYNSVRKIKLRNIRK